MTPFLEDELSRLDPDIADTVRNADVLLEETGFWIVRKPTIPLEAEMSPEFEAWMAST